MSIVEIRRIEGNASGQDPAPFHGAYVIDKRVAQPDRAALDDELGEKLWAENTRLVGL